MEFLRNSNEDEKSKIILKNILNLTEDLGLISLTEGVETEKQFKMLSEMGCKLFQGYYFSKPMTVKEFEDYLVKATRYKAGLLRIATQEMLAMKERRTSN